MILSISMTSLYLTIYNAFLVSCQAQQFDINSHQTQPTIPSINAIVTQLKELQQYQYPELIEIANSMPDHTRVSRGDFVPMHAETTKPSGYLSIARYDDDCSRPPNAIQGLGTDICLIDPDKQQGFDFSCSDEGYYVEVSVLEYSDLFCEGSIVSQLNLAIAKSCINFYWISMSCTKSMQPWIENGGGVTFRVFGWDEDSCSDTTVYYMLYPTHQCNLNDPDHSELGSHTYTCANDGKSFQYSQFSDEDCQSPVTSIKQDVDDTCFQGKPSFTVPDYRNLFSNQTIDDDIQDFTSNETYGRLQCLYATSNDRVSSLAMLGGGSEQAGIGILIAILVIFVVCASGGLYYYSTNIKSKVYVSKANDTSSTQTKGKIVLTAQPQPSQQSTIHSNMTPTNQSHQFYKDTPSNA